MITKLTAEIKYLATYSCAKCGRQQQGSTARARCNSLQEMHVFMNRPVPVSSHNMPVGWASHLRDGRQEFDCPVCVGSVR